MVLRNILIAIGLLALGAVPVNSQSAIEATVVILPPSDTGVWRVQMAFSGAREKQWLFDRFNTMLVQGKWQGRITRVRPRIVESSAGGTSAPVGADVIGEVQSLVPQPGQPFPIDAFISALAELKTINIVYFGGNVTVTDLPGVWKNRNITVRVSNLNGLAQFNINIDDPKGALSAPSRGPQDMRNRILVICGLCLLALGVGIVVYTVAKGHSTHTSGSSWT